jgi:hypothetical protein
MITNRSDCVLKCWFFSQNWRTIYTRDNPRRMSRVRETPCCNVIFVREKTIQVNPWSPGKGKTPTGAYRSNLAHMKKAKRVKNRRNLRGGRFGF